MENTEQNTLAELIEPATIVYIHGLKYEIDEETNQACFYVANIEENSDTLSGKSKKFLWQSQKWIVTLYDESKLPKQNKTKPNERRRTVRRRTKNKNEGIDYEVTEVIILDIKDNHTGTAHLREYTWKPKVVNTEESFILVTYSDENEESQEKDITANKHSTSYVGNTTHEDFEMTYDDEDDYRNNHEEPPIGALARLTYVSEKLTHIQKLVIDDNEEKERYEIDPVNIKISYEPAIIWAVPYEGKYGLSTSHFQLSERFGNSCERSLIKVTTRGGTRGGYLSDFSLSYSDVQRVKKYKNKIMKPQYDNLPSDVVVIDKLEEEEESKSTSDDEGFEDIEIEATDKKHQKTELLVDIPNSPHSNYGSSSSPHEYSEIMVSRSPKHRYNPTQFSTGSERTDSESSNSNQQRFYEEEIFITNEVTELESTVLENPDENGKSNTKHASVPTYNLESHENSELNMEEIDTQQSSTNINDGLEPTEFNAQSKEIQDMPSFMKTKSIKLPDELSEFQNFQCKGINERCVVTDTRQLNEEIIDQKPMRRNCNKTDINISIPNTSHRPVLFASEVIYSDLDKHIEFDDVVDEEDGASIPSSSKSELTLNDPQMLIDEVAFNEVDTTNHDVHQEISFDSLDLDQTDSIQISIDNKHTEDDDILKLLNLQHKFLEKPVTQELDDEIVNQKRMRINCKKNDISISKLNTFHQPVLFASEVIYSDLDKDKEFDDIADEEDGDSLASHLKPKVTSNDPQMLIDEVTLNEVDTKSHDVHQEISFNSLDLDQTDSIPITVDNKNTVDSELSKLQHTVVKQPVTQELDDEIVDQKPKRINCKKTDIGISNPNTFHQPVLFASEIIYSNLDENKEFNDIVDEEDGDSVPTSLKSEVTLNDPQMLIDEVTFNEADTTNHDVHQEISFDSLDLDQTDSIPITVDNANTEDNELSKLLNLQYKITTEPITQELDAEIVQDRSENGYHITACNKTQDRNIIHHSELNATKIVSAFIEEGDYQHESIDSKVRKYREIIDDDSVQDITKIPDLQFSVNFESLDESTNGNIPNNIFKEKEHVLHKLKNEQNFLEDIPNDPLDANTLNDNHSKEDIPSNHHSEVDISTNQHSEVDISTNQHSEEDIPTEPPSEDSYTSEFNLNMSERKKSNISLKLSTSTYADLDHSSQVTSTSIDLKNPQSNTSLKRETITISPGDGGENKEINDGVKRKKSLKSRAKKMILKPFKSGKPESNKEAKDTVLENTEKVGKDKKKKISRFNFKKQNSTDKIKSPSLIPKSQSDTTGNTFGNKIESSMPKSHSDTTGSAFGKNSKHVYKRSETQPLASITQRITLLRQNSSENILDDDDAMDVFDYSHKPRVKRSHSFDSILNDPADKESERELKERRRRLAGYSYVNDNRIPTETEIIKSRKYSIEACEKETQKEINFIKKERKKSKSTTNLRVMGASLEVLEKIQSIGYIEIPDVFLGNTSQHDASKTKGSVGKINIPQAFSIDDLDSIGNDKRKLKFTLTEEMNI